MKCKLKIRMIAALIVATAPCATIAEDGQIVHDAEYRILERQHGERWAAEDAEIDMKLAEIRERNGEKGGKAREVNVEPGHQFSQQDYIDMEEGYKASALKQLDRLAAGDKPFFLQYWPMFPISFTRTDIRQAQTLNGGPIAESIVKVDGWVGEILDRVNELGIADNTIVVVMGDNGPFMEFVSLSGQSAGFTGVERPITSKVGFASMPMCAGQVLSRPTRVPRISPMYRTCLQPSQELRVRTKVSRVIGSLMEWISRRSG
ncbi:MAG: sulfatase-like hydrolase/transferase [Gammaproteobacteria bacterium]|nr:sulfatase-like hydrolase/transferase [Gammaproteobacteria bacterium]